MKVNVSIDDVSPHQFSSVRVLENCEQLIEEFPDIKISLFIPTAYWRTIKSGTTTKVPLKLSNFPEFCEEISELDPKNYEVGFHGYYHGIPGRSDNDEFQHLTYDETNGKIDLMMEEVTKSGLNTVFKKMFRPPAWRMNPDAFKCLSDRGFDLFALTDIEYAVETYAGAHKQYAHTMSNQFPPFRPLEVVEKCGIVYHACEWDKNFLNSEKTEELISFINLSGEREFVFLGDFCE
jgi:predicted deacetylase